MQYHINELLFLRFVGPDLTKNSTPIYELGNSFVTLQDLIYETYNFQIDNGIIGIDFDGKHKARQKNTTIERNLLSLRVSQVTEGSDIYSFLPFIADPTFQGILTNIISSIIFTFGEKVYEKIKSSINNANNSTSRYLIRDDMVDEKLLIRVFSKYQKLASQVKRNVGIEKIEVSDKSHEKLILDRESSNKYQFLKEILLVGEEQKFECTFVSLNAVKGTIEVVTSSNQKVTVFFANDKLFKEVHYRSVIARDFCFIGIPHYKFGYDPGKFIEFFAYDIIQAS